MKSTPKSSTSTLHIDGRTLEGGGQLLRLALGLSSLLNRPLQITHIRGQRPGGGGIKSQHLACVRWLAAASNAETEGADIRSSTLSFRPNVSLTGLPKNYTGITDQGSKMLETRVDVGSPGSIGLVLQAILPFVLFRSPPIQSSEKERTTVKVTISGGTNVSNSPSYEYVSQVLLPTLRLIGLPSIESQLERRGWSTGGSSIGSAVFIIPVLQPGEELSAEGLGSLTGIEETERHLSSIQVTVLAPEALHEEFRNCIHAAVGRGFDTSVGIDIDTEETQHEKRIYLIIVAKVKSKDHEYRFGSDELFQGRNKHPGSLVEAMTGRVIDRLLKDIKSGACVDKHMIDQLVVFQALAKGESNVSRGVAGSQSLHAETAEWITREMIGSSLDMGKGHGIGLPAGGTKETTADANTDAMAKEMGRLTLN